MRATQVQATPKAETIRMLTCERVASKAEPDLTKGRPATPKELLALCEKFKRR